MLAIKNLRIIELLKSIHTILNNIPFSFYALLFIFAILLNVDQFSSTGSQGESIRNVIIYLGLFFSISWGFTALRNPIDLKKDLDKNKGLWGLFSFIIFFLVFGVIFSSFEGKLDSTFVYGLFASSSFLLYYMFIVSFFEESIFRNLIVNYFKSKSNNRIAVYILASLIFSLYHYFKYSGNFVLLLTAFLAGLGFTWIKLNDELLGFASFPIAISLHLIFNLYAIGALSIVFSTLGVNV